MPAEIIGLNNSGTTAKFLNANAFVFPASFFVDNATSVVREFSVRSRTNYALSFAIYENTVDDLETANLLDSVSGFAYNSKNDSEYYEHKFKSNIQLNQNRYYWIGIKCPTSFYINTGTGTNFAIIDAYDSGTDTWPATVGTTTASATSAFNCYAEVVDISSKLITVIGSSPDATEYSLLKIGAEYQASGTQIRYDEFTTNLNTVTVFDNGRFLITGEGSDSFEYELAEPGGSFGDPITATITDASVDEVA